MENNFIFNLFKYQASTKMFASDPVVSVSCEVGPSWIRPVYPAHPTDGGNDLVV